MYDEAVNGELSMVNARIKRIWPFTFDHRRKSRIDQVAIGLIQHKSVLRHCVRKFQISAAYLKLVLWINCATKAD